ncbi:MAG: DUF1080 domain-containing protein [Muribaculum sp.]|nr:DUF1080 domain-containing protein [Muribaculaceae bacterium]MCM1081238.1 DUF1080 domain-containing protein [Muribaculum sp.]
MKLRYRLCATLACAVAIISALASEKAPSGLNKKEFNKFWRVESEGPHSVVFHGDTVEITAPKGLSLWRKEKMSGRTIIEYDAQVVSENEGDRLSDLNCFWMASDPKAADIWKRLNQRGGKFVNSYALKLYYLGYGGNNNTTTRFRRYNGDERGIDSAEYRPAIIKEYTDADNLLKPGKWYHIKITTDGLRTQYFIDGKRLVDFRDPDPLTQGWFAFRTTLSRTRLTNFSYCCEPLQENDVPLNWIGSQPTADAPVTFGVPFDAGTVTKSTTLSLVSDSATIPVESWPLSYWPDGSVKWAAVATTVPAGANNLKVHVDNSKKKSPAKPSMLASVSNGVITVQAGDTRVYIPQKQGCNLIDSITLGNIKVGGAARLVASVQDVPDGDVVTTTALTSRVAKAVIERNGSEKAVVKLTGVHRTADGRQWLPWTVRLYFYAGCPDIKMTHTFIFDGDQEKDFIKSLGVEYEVPMRELPYNRHVAFATQDGGVWSEPVQPLVGRRVLAHPSSKNKRTPLMQITQMEGKRVPDYSEFDPAGKKLIDEWAQWDGFRLSQNGPDGFTIRKRATAKSPWLGTYSGSRAQGCVYLGDVSGGMAVGMKDFWQSCPSGLEVNGARDSIATITAWLWNPDAEAMDLRHYDVRAHGLNSSYEDVQEGMSTPYGVARTSTITIRPDKGFSGKANFAAIAQGVNSESVLLPTPDYLHRRKAFGIWSLPDRSTAARAEVEARLDDYASFYNTAIDQNRWYGFWHYGDFMHAYDPVRHCWKYDVGGYAWDNTELASNLWLWYQFLRTGDPNLWRMATAMTRHASEVDVYHIGPNAGLGSRHNVSHWGCGAKEARISQAAFNRIMYYLTADERLGDLMTDVTDSDQKLYTLDPMRLAEPRELYPCTSPARLRFGPDWLAYAGNWMTEWERTGNTAYRDKIIAGMKSICKLPSRLFTGPLALGYDPATGIITTECDPKLQTTNHLMTIMGGFEIMNEMMEVIPDPAWEDAWLEHATNYKQKALELTHNRFRVSRLQAYSAWKRGDKKLASEAWTELLTRSENADAPRMKITKITVPAVPANLDEADPISTNDAAMWSLDAIYMQETIPMD